jgi:hypothetical protein
VSELAKGAGLKILSRRRSRVRIPSPAIILFFLFLKKKRRKALMEKKEKNIAISELRMYCRAKAKTVPACARSEPCFANPFPRKLFFQIGMPRKGHFLLGRNKNFDEKERRTRTSASGGVRITLEYSFLFRADALQASLDKECGAFPNTHPQYSLCANGMPCGSFLF